MKQTLLVVALAVAVAACDAPFWVKHNREDAELARQEVVRIQARQTSLAEESRRLLALCLDIAKLERQWKNYSGWTFDQASGACTVEYKKPPSDIKSKAACAAEWLKDEGARDGDAPSASASSLERVMYYDCVSETFSKVWNVRADS
ncbi:MAG TPA: hypothetical protein VMT87_16930 [Vicinamibacteria bacterium]|nr:hypothetical protein [Vicinamibacteria bacterium]